MRSRRILAQRSKDLRQAAASHGGGMSESGAADQFDLYDHRALPALI
jgi:hypothetical protein